MSLYFDANIALQATKEKVVLKIILKIFPTQKWQYNTIISKGRSLKRPDMFVDLTSHMIIVEIDENAHRYYNEEDEKTRIISISRDAGNKPCVFIRFNPDGYCNASGEKILSCWEINNKSIRYIKNKYNWKTRINTLIQTIKYWNNKIPKKTKVIKLFYDEYVVSKLKYSINNLCIINASCPSTCCAPSDLYCNSCDYKASTSYHYERHLQSNKHKNNIQYQKELDAVNNSLYIYNMNKQNASNLIKLNNNEFKDHNYLLNKNIVDQNTEKPESTNDKISQQNENNIMCS
jgi:hypothetical protein